MDHGHSVAATVAAQLSAAAQKFDARAARLAAAGPGKRRPHGQSETTRAAYLRDLSLYLDLCERTGQPLGTAVTMRVFAEHLMQRPVEQGKNKGRIGWAPNSIRRALSSVRTYHELTDGNLPSLVLAGERIAEYAEGRAADPTTSDGQGAPALRLPTLDAMFDALPPGTNATVRDRALLSLGWAMMAPRLLLSSIDLDHVQTVPAGLEITVYRNPVTGRLLAAPRTVTVPWMPQLGPLCPVTNTLAWITLLRTLNIVDGPLLRSVDKYDNVKGSGKHAGPPGVGFRMDPQTVEYVVARAAAMAALPDSADLTSQSLRRGGVEDAYAGGSDVPVISRHAGYSDQSTQVFRWIGDSIRSAGSPLAGVTYERRTLDNLTEDA